MSDKEGHSMLIFYSLGNFVSTQESFDALLEGMGCFTIQKTVQNGKTTVEILDPEVKPMVMHYNKDAGGIQSVHAVRLHRRTCFTA